MFISDTARIDIGSISIRRRQRRVDIDAMLMRVVLVVFRLFAKGGSKRVYRWPSITICLHFTHRIYGNFELMSLH